MTVNDPDQPHAGDALPNQDRSGSIPPITEKQLARLWQRRAARHAALRTEQGSRIRVLYPGRPGVTAGPDFRDALLLVEGQALVQGDVEVHLRQHDWRAHGHHQDPNYNGVALHVTLEAGGAPSRTVSGRIPPVVDLHALLDTPSQSEDANGTRDHLWRLLEGSGYRRPETAERMSALLNRAGDDRFLWRSRELQHLMTQQSPAQTLWESVCEALGYRHNQHAFIQLAAAAPIATLENLARRLPKARRSAELTATLLELAGFNNRSTAGAPGTASASLGPRLDPSQWKLFRVRPSNHPRRRVTAAALLLDRFAGSGLAPGLAHAAALGKPARLTEALIVPGDSHGGSALLGPGRAKDIAINAVLPFLHGWNTLAGDAGAAGAVLQLYRRYGKLTENEITREMASALQDPAWGPIARNARQQQGLIHLQRLLAGANGSKKQREQS